MERYFDNIYEKLYKEPETSDLWYKARHYVLDYMDTLDGDGIKINDSKHVHVVFDELNRNTLAVARQIALIAHYPNFNEKTCQNRTLITFYNSQSESDISINNIEEVKFINRIVDFGNLFDRCLYSFDGERRNEEYQDVNKNNYFPLDIEFEFKTEVYNELNNKESDKIIKSSEIEIVFDTFKGNEIDITKGVYVNMVYNTGVEIDNLPACDNDNVRRYDTALRVFCYKLKKDHIKQRWDNTAKPNDSGKYKDIDVKNQISSIFCADCFESRLRSILDTSEKSVKEYLAFNFNEVMKTLCSEDDNYKVLNALAYCEHNRWNVERLIMGFSPLGSKDRFELECIFGKERKCKIRDFKNEKKHIDLCSNYELRRVNPADVKYDYFLMLAMPQILQSYYKIK